MKDIRKWLSPPDPKKNYDLVLELRHGETGAWFMNSNAFLEWKVSGGSSLLWVHGKRQFTFQYLVLRRG
jgi:hypothetical protein